MSECGWGCGGKEGKRRGTGSPLIHCESFGFRNVNQNVGPCAAKADGPPQARTHVPASARLSASVSVPEASDLNQTCTTKMHTHTQVNTTDSLSLRMVHSQTESVRCKYRCHRGAEGATSSHQTACYRKEHLCTCMADDRLGYSCREKRSSIRSITGEVATWSDREICSGRAQASR